MVMSNYMDLLGMYAPWFLILFMVVPMTLAELVLCSEIFSLLNKEKAENSWPGLRKGASICLSIIFIFLFIYLVVAYIPTVAWKGQLGSPVYLLLLSSYYSGRLFTFYRNRHCR